MMDSFWSKYVVHVSKKWNSVILSGKRKKQDAILEQIRRTRVKKVVQKEDVPPRTANESLSVDVSQIPNGNPDCML